jgi:hypothetical protein
VKRVGTTADPAPHLRAEDAGPAGTDAAALIGLARVRLHGCSTAAVVSDLSPAMAAELRRRFGYRSQGSGCAQTVLASEVALELGHPSTASVSMVLWTRRLELVRAGRVTRVGPDFDALSPGERRPFAQIVLVALGSGACADPFDLDRTQYLINRLPGYAVRAVPGRLWARISKQARQAGLSLDGLGAALASAYGDGLDGVRAVECLFVTSCAGDVESLQPVAAEAQSVAGRYRKLVLTQNTGVPCEVLACDTCAHKPVCDNLRGIVRRRRRRT